MVVDDVIRDAPAHVDHLEVEVLLVAVCDERWVGEARQHIPLSLEICKRGENITRKYKRNRYMKNVKPFSSSHKQILPEKVELRKILTVDVGLGGRSLNDPSRTRKVFSSISAGLRWFLPDASALLCSAVSSSSSAAARNMDSSNSSIVFVRPVTASSGGRGNGPVSPATSDAMFSDRPTKPKSDSMPARHGLGRILCTRICSRGDALEGLDSNFKKFQVSDKNNFLQHKNVWRRGEPAPLQRSARG